MKNIYTYVTAYMAACLFMCTCSDNQETEEPKPTFHVEEEEMPEYERIPAKAIELGESEKTMNEGMKTFAWKLFGAELNDGMKDVLVSPFSTEADFAVLLCGLKDKSRQELADIMGLGNVSDEEIGNYFATMQNGVAEADKMTRFASAHSLWYSSDLQLNQTFAEKAGSIYGVETYPVRFGTEATRLINEWCAMKTYNRITEFLKETDATDMTHLINAIYFRASWAQRFDKAATKTRPFTDASGETQQVEMMNRMFSVGTRYDRFERFETFLLPFNNGAFAMFFVLPEEGTKPSDIMPDLIKTGISTGTSEQMTYVDFFVPKFEGLYRFSMKSSLRALGAEEIFTNGDDYQLFTNWHQPLDDVMQECTLAIDETGAEAAAVTDIRWKSDSGGQAPPVITLEMNRPFIYGIVEKSTGMPLFIGSKGKI